MRSAHSHPYGKCGTVTGMVGVAARIVLLLGLAAAAACGPSNDYVSPTDGLLEAPTYAGRSSSSSSGAPSPAPTASSSSASSSSGSSGTVTPPDDAGNAPTCGPLWALTAAAVVPGLPATAIRPTFSSDELTVYFVQPNGAGLYRVYAATRPTRGDPFQAPVEMGPNVNGGLHSYAVFASASGLELVFNNYDGDNSQVLQATRTAPSEAFGPASLRRANAILEVAARDDSVRFFARNVSGSTAIFQLRPGNAADDQATVLSTGVPTWYEAESGTLWFEQFSPNPSPAFYPRSARWDGMTWSDSIPADMRVYWISPDGCRLYGVDAQGIVVRDRVPAP